MPKEKRFQIGEYYLVKHSNSPVFKAGWYDASAGQTRRASLGTQNLEEAKLKLYAFIQARTKPVEVDAAEMPLATVLQRYFENYACKLPSHEAARHALVHWLDFWGPSTLSDLAVDRQEQFVSWMKDKGFSNSYCSRNLSVGRAAINRAYKRGEIKSAPHIIDVSDRSDGRQPYRLNQGEMRRFLMKVQEWPHLFMFSMIMLNTLARPEAALELAPAQIDHQDRLVRLNPPGRKQTKKFRATVPLTDTLRPLLQVKDVPAFVMWNEKPIKSVKKSFALAVEKAGLPDDITPYSLRHTMAKELRKRGVPVWEVQGMLGHRVPGVTENYAEFDPDYLGKGRQAIDAYFTELGLHFEASVSPTCQRLKTKKSAEADFSISSSNWMVGVTGIEPVTPTMST